MENESHGSWPSGGSQDEFSPIKKGNNNHNNNSQHHSSNNNKEQDRFLPIANVGRIMKKVIPGNGKISKDAKETVQECVSEFISFVTGEASDKCQREKRKTINGDDVIWAITTLGFEDYVDPLKVYLNKYRELEGDKLNVPNKQQHRSDQELQQHQIHEHNPTLPFDHPHRHHPHSVYPSSFITPPTFLTADQPFPLPFSPTSVPKQIPQEQHIESGGHW